MIWAMVDRRCGPERKNGRGGDRDGQKNKRQMSRGSRVADRCDVQRGAQAVVQVEKGFPLWCRWRRNQPRFVSADGLCSRGHWEQDTNPVGLCSAGALIKAVSQYLGCVWTGVSETRSDLSQGTLSLLLLLLSIFLPASSLSSWLCRVEYYNRHIVNLHDSTFTCGMWQEHGSRWSVHLRFQAYSVIIFRLMDNSLTAWIKRGNVQWQRHETNWFHIMGETPVKLTRLHKEFRLQIRPSVAGPFWLWVLTRFLLWIMSGNTFRCPLMISTPNGLGWIRLFLINMTYQEAAHCQLTSC